MKKLVALMLALVMVLALTACGGGGAPAADKPADAPAAAPADKPADAAPAEKPADGKVYTLVVTNHDAVTSVGEQYVENFLDQISEASGGRLVFNYNAGGSLVGGPDSVEAVRTGMADICWNATSLVGSVFPIAEFCNVPLNGITCAQMGSKVFYDMFNEIPECAAEFKDFKVIEVQCCSTAPLCTVESKIETPDDFKGRSIRAAGAVQSTYIGLLGAAPQSIPTPDVYENMEKAIVKGMTNDWHNIDCFKLYEVTDYCMDYPINLTSCFLLMNKDAYNALPADLQELIDSYAQYGSDMAGYYWDCMRFITGDKMEQNGVEIYQPSDDVREFMSSQDKADAMKEWYIGYLGDQGYDNAQEIWDKCIEIVNRYADQYTDPFGTRLELSDWDPASIANYK